MPELLPNLSDLLEALPDAALAADARELAEAADGAATLDDVDEALMGVVQRWLQGPGAA